MKNKYDNKARYIIASIVMIGGLALLAYAIIKESFLWGIIGLIVALLGSVLGTIGKYGINKGMEEMVKMTKSYDLTLEKEKAKAMAKGLKEGLEEDNKK